jgi:hypothetical protein
MASPKSGSPGTIVDPAAPKAPEEADQSDPGQIEAAKARQRQTGTGKYGAAPVKPLQPAEAPPPGQEQERSWIAIELVGEDGKGIAGERYRITVPDGSVDEGTLDAQGRARVEGFEPGSCKVSFPELDQAAWEDA